MVFDSFLLNSSALSANAFSSSLLTSAPRLPAALPRAVPSPLGVGFLVPDLGALGDSLTPPLGPTSANSISSS